MNRPQPLLEGEKLMVQFRLCALDLSLLSLSERLNIPLDRWVEPGMGPASGFGCRLGSGEMVFLEELEYARASFGTGPVVYIEAESLVEHGIEQSLSTVLIGLSLPRDCVDWVQTEEGRESARVVAAAARIRAAKAQGI